jgi:molecular chaperone Hsp33
MADLILRATGTKAPLRYVLADLTQTATAICARHGARAWTMELMAECMIGSVFLSSMLKYAGVANLRTTWSGDLTLVEADSTPMGLIRARVPHAEALALGDFEPAITPVGLQVRKFNEKARLVSESLLDLPDRSIGRSLSWFLLQSEQTRSAVGITAEFHRDHPDQLLYAAGWMIEAFPDADAATIATAEQTVLGLPHLGAYILPGGYDLPGLLRSLAGGIETTIHREIIPSAYCPCDRARMEGNLISLGAAQLQEILAEQDHIELTCDFCRNQYDFSRAELEALIDLNAKTPKEKP